MKNKNTLLVLGIAVLLVIVVGTTFAFFVSQNAERQEIGAKVKTQTGDTSTFLVNGDLSFTADQETFSLTSGDKASTATGRVIFRAGSENENGSDLCYTVKLQITSNNFNYSNSMFLDYGPEAYIFGGYPELVLQAKYADITSYTNTAPVLDITSGSLHTSGTKIKYVTVPVASANNETGYVGRSAAISGYDVTINQDTLYMSSGTFIDGNENIHKIHAGAGETVEQDWIFKLNFINYEWDQAEVSNPNNNNNKTFDAQVVFETTTCPTETTPTYAYWNNNGNNQNFISTSMPNDVTKPSPEGRTYASRELLANAFDANERNYYNFSNVPFYIRTTLNNGTAAGHEACLYYNNHEICLGPNYWTGTIGTTDATAGENTKAKLQADMEAALGTSADSCDFSVDKASCNFGSFYCSANSNGFVNCGKKDASLICGAGSDYAFSSMQ